jgi:hypothetical protein
MNRKLATLFALTALLIVAVSAFAQEDGDFTPIVSEGTVQRMADGSEVEGASSRLTRFQNGVTTAISTIDLNPGHVYTLWWVVFNAPENCSDGVCNADDIFVFENGAIPRDEAGNRVMNMDGIAAANISIQHAAGGLAVDGTLNTSASLGEGEVPGIVAGPGLLDAETAEIHLVVRTHGEKVDSAFLDQVSTFGGGCEPMDALPCDDVQFSIHLPPAQD